MKRSYPYYSDLLKKIKDIQKFFDVFYISLDGEKFSLLKFEFSKYKNRPLLVLMAGCHGEEPAPVLALFQNYKIFKKRADALKISLNIYPLVNPWGFDRNIRCNRININCNKTKVHKKTEHVAIETKTLIKDLQKLKPKIFVNLHEDDETKKEFYLYSFGQRKYEKPLVRVGGRHFPVLKDGEYYAPDTSIKVKNGVDHNFHDGSIEDFMFHQGAKFSCCAETPSRQPLQKRIKCNIDLILKLIELTAS